MIDDYFEMMEARFISFFFFFFNNTHSFQVLHSFKIYSNYGQLNHQSLVYPRLQSNSFIPNLWYSGYENDKRFSSSYTLFLSILKASYFVSILRSDHSQIVNYIPWWLFHYACITSVCNCIFLFLLL